MTCMSMYKTTKIVPVKVVRLIDFLVLCPGRSDLLPTACLLVLKQHPTLSVMSRVLYNEEKEQCFSIRFKRQYIVLPQRAITWFNSEGKKCFPPCTPSIGLQVNCTPSVASRHLECFSLQRSSTLAMANLEQLVALLYVSWYEFGCFHNQCQLENLACVDCSMAETQML